MKTLLSTQSSWQPAWPTSSCRITSTGPSIRRQDFERFSREEKEKGVKYADAPERFYLSKIVEDYKRHVAFVVNGARGTRGVQVWQDGSRDDGLRTPDAIRRAAHYVVMNPVKAGWVERPEDYLYLAWDEAWLV